MPTPNKKITKTLINLKKQEKLQEEVDNFITKFIRKAKIQKEDTNSPEFKNKIEQIRNEMLGVKPKKEQREGIGGLRGLVEDFDNLQELETKITNSLDELETIKVELGNELRGIKIKTNELLSKQTDWEEVLNKPEIILQDEFYQEQEKSDERNKRAFNLIQVLKDEISNVREYFGQLIKGVSSEIAQLRNRKINHSELIGITRDQHHQEKHTLESHITSKLMSELKRLVDGGIVDDLHRHREMVSKGESKTFASIGRTTLSTESLNSLVNGTETVFVVSYEPIFVMADGQVMTDGNGYSYSSGSITMDNAPQAVLINFYNS